MVRQGGGRVGASVPNAPGRSRLRRRVSQRTIQWLAGGGTTGPRGGRGPVPVTGARPERELAAEAPNDLDAQADVATCVAEPRTAYGSAATCKRRPLRPTTPSPAGPSSRPVRPRPSESDSNWRIPSTRWRVLAEAGQIETARAALAEFRATADRARQSGGERLVGAVLDAR